MYTRGILGAGHTLEFFLFSISLSSEIHSDSKFSKFTSRTTAVAFVKSMVIFDLSIKPLRVVGTFQYREGLQGNTRGVS